MGQKEQQGSEMVDKCVEKRMSFKERRELLIECQTDSFTDDLVRALRGKPPRDSADDSHKEDDAPLFEETLEIGVSESDPFGIGWDKEKCEELFRSRDSQVSYPNLDQQEGNPGAW